MVKTFYFSDESALIQHLERRRALMITMYVAAPRDTVINVAHAAIMAGVRYVFPSSYGHCSANQILYVDLYLIAERSWCL